MYVKFYHIASYMTHYIVYCFKEHAVYDIDTDNVDIDTTSCTDTDIAGFI